MHHLVFFAVPQELAPFQRLLTQHGVAMKRAELEGLPKRAQVLCGAGLTLVVTGMGPENARVAAAQAIAAFSPSAVWTCGYAGGLNSELKLGEVVFEADRAFPWTAALVQKGARLGRLVTTAKVATSRAEKGVLRQQSGADAVDMESAIIRALALERGIPSATVRVISDTAAEDLPLDFNALSTTDGGLDPWKMAWVLLSSPGKIPCLIRFGKTTANAAKCLAEALAVLMPDLKR